MSATNSAPTLRRRDIWRLLLAPECLQREVFVSKRDVVGQLVERQPRATVAAQIGHLELTRRPDALHRLIVAVGETPHDLVVDVILEPLEGVAVLANPDDRSRV